MSRGQRVPFLDLVTPHLEMEEELVTVFRETLRTGKFIGGAEVEEFENDFARHCDVKYCVGVGSGTDALRFALIAAGVRKGETALTVPNTFMATTEAISQAGAIMDFVDIDECTYNMDPANFKDYLETKCKVDTQSGRPINITTGRTVTAVVPVHLYGQMADMDPIRELADRYNMTVIEDACQAHGAEYFSRREDRWRKAGSLGHVAAFSFYPGKNLGACGEGGAVTTNDPVIARRVRMLRDHGQSEKYYHEIEGYNGRLDAIQASILRIKLRHLHSWNEKRRRNAYNYNKLFFGMPGVCIPYEPEWSRAVYHLYILRTPVRDVLRDHLKENHISTGLHYPRPLHLQRAYAGLGYKKGDFPASEEAASEILSLPMFPGLNENQQVLVVENIAKFFNKTVNLV